MAKGRKTVNIGIKFPSKSETNKQLDELLASVSKLSGGIKIKLDDKELSKSFSGIDNILKDLQSTLSKLSPDAFKEINKETQEATAQQIKYQKVLGKSLNIGDGSKGFSELQSRANEIRSTVDELAKINFNTTKNGALKDATITYTDNMGKVVTETMKWKTVATETEGVMKRIFTTTNIGVSDNVQKLGQIQAKLESTKSLLQNRLDTSKNNGFVDESVINGLQQRLNSINTNTAEKEINDLKNAITNLSSSDSQIVRVQNKILSMENTLTSLKTKYGGLVGNSDTKSQLSQYETQLSSLKNILSDLTNGKTIDGSKLSSEINKGSDATRKLSNGVKDSGEALKLATKDAQSFGGAFKQMMTKVGLASVSYMIFNELRKNVRSGIEAVKEMDSAITTLKITMNGMTDTGLKSMVKQSQELATNLSSTTSKVLEAVKTFANASETIDSIMAKTSSAIILSNLTGLDTKTTVNTIQSATKQFDALSDGSEKSAMKVTDSMTAISKSLGLDFSEGVKQMSESISILGSLSQQLGGDLDSTLALISGGMEKLRINGSEMATSLKTIKFVA